MRSLTVNLIGQFFERLGRRYQFRGLDPIQTCLKRIEIILRYDFLALGCTP